MKRETELCNVADLESSRNNKPLSTLLKRQDFSSSSPPSPPPQHHEAKKKHSMKGIIFIMLGALIASLMFLVVKLLADNADAFTLVFYRGLVVVVLSLTTLVREGTNPLGLTEVRMWLVFRAAFGATAVCAWFFGCQILPLPDAVTLQFTTPPFAAAFAVCLVGEQWKPLDMVGAVVCLTGVALIAHPTWLFGNDNSASSDDDNSTVADIWMKGLAVVITTIGAAIAGLAYVCVRVIGNRTSAVVMLFYYGTVGMFVAIIGSIFFKGDWNVFVGKEHPFGLHDYALIFLVGLLGHLSQWLVNLGLQHETAATATLATCTQIVWTYTFELAFLHEEINVWSLGGSVLILGYMLVVAVIKMLYTDDSARPAPALAPAAPPSSSPPPRPAGVLMREDSPLLNDSEHSAL